MNQSLFKLISLDESYSYKNAQNFIPSELLKEMPDPMAGVINVYSTGDGTVSLVGEGNSIPASPSNLIWTGTDSNSWFLKRPAVFEEGRSMDYYMKYVTIQAVPTDLWRQRDPSDIIMLYIDEPPELYSTRPEKLADWIDRKKQVNEGNIYDSYLFEEATATEEKARTEREDFVNKYLEVASKQVSTFLRILSKVDSRVAGREDTVRNSVNALTEKEAQAFKLLDNTANTRDLATYMGSVNAVNTLANIKPGTVMDVVADGKFGKYKFGADDKAIFNSILIELMKEDWFDVLDKTAKEDYGIDLTPGGEGQASRRANKLMRKAADEASTIEDANEVTFGGEKSGAPQHRREAKPGRFDFLGKRARSIKDDKERSRRGTRGWFDLVVLTDEDNYKGAVHALLQRLDKRSRVSLLRRNRIKKAFEETGQKLIVKAARFKPYDTDSGSDTSFDIPHLRKALAKSISKGNKIAVVADNFTAKDIMGGARTRSDREEAIDSQGRRVDNQGNVTDIEVSKDSVKANPNDVGVVDVEHDGKTVQVYKNQIVKLTNGNYGIPASILTGDKGAIAIPKGERKDTGIRGAFRRAYDKVVKGDKVGGHIAGDINRELQRQDKDAIDKGEEGMNLITFDKAAEKLGKKQAKYHKKKSLRDHL
jgi:hypothetical protein